MPLVATPVMKTSIDDGGYDEYELRSFFKKLYMRDMFMVEVLKSSYFNLTEDLVNVYAIENMVILDKDDLKDYIKNHRNDLFIFYVKCVKQKIQNSLEDWKQAIIKSNCDSFCVPRTVVDKVKNVFKKYYLDKNDTYKIKDNIALLTDELKSIIFDINTMSISEYSYVGYNRTMPEEDKYITDIPFSKIDILKVFENIDFFVDNFIKKVTTDPEGIDLKMHFEYIANLLTVIYKALIKDRILRGLDLKTVNNQRVIYCDNKNAKTRAFKYSTVDPTAAMCMFLENRDYDFSYKPFETLNYYSDVYNYFYYYLTYIYNR